MFSPMHLQHIQDTSMVDSTGWDDQTQQASSPRKDIVMYNFFPTKSEEHSSSMSLEASPQGENNRVQVKPPRRYTDAEVHDMFDERWKVKLPEVKEERITKYRSDSLEDFNERQHKAYNRHRNKVKSDLAEEIGFTVSAVDHITRNQSPGGPNHTHRVYLDKELERKRLQEEFDKGNIAEIPQILPKRNYPLNAQAKREAKKNKRRMESQEAGSSVAHEHGNLQIGPGAAAYEEHAIPYMNQGNAGYVQGYQVYRTDVPQQHFNPGQQGGGVTAWMGQGNGGNEYVYGYPVYPTPSQGDHSNSGYGHYQGFPHPWQG